MKVIVDYDSCDAYGECVKACPEVFELTDDDDQVRLLQEEPDESLREKVNRAVAACPKAALRIEG
jgi:ferredoxin